MDLGKNFIARLILAVFSTVLEEVAIYAIWRWLLPEFDVNLPFYAVIVLMVLWGIFSVLTFIVTTRTLARKGQAGMPTMLGTTGKVAREIRPGSDEGQVRIKGELWTAESTGDRISPGEQVEVVGEDGLKLIVRRKQ